MNRMGQTDYRVNSKSIAPFGREQDETETSPLFDREGNRKYLTNRERGAFLHASRELPEAIQTFCSVLAYSGARVSEVLALTPARIDAAAGVVIIESLKKRRRGHFRAIPIPPDLLNELDRVHGLARRRQSDDRKAERLWPWCRTTAWNHVTAVMAAASVDGPQATPKGLRHAFAVAALQAGVPINLVRKWLGHARLSTTEIYANAMGEEERAI